MTTTVEETDVLARNLAALPQYRTRNNPGGLADDAVASLLQVERQAGLTNRVLLVPPTQPHGNMWEVSTSQISNYPFLAPFRGAYGWFVTADVHVGERVAEGTGTLVEDVVSPVQVLAASVNQYRVRTTLNGYLTAGRVVPFIRETRAGRIGVALAPPGAAGSDGMWVVNEGRVESTPALRPFIGWRGQWCYDHEVEFVSERGEVTAGATVTHAVDLSAVPEEHRATIPAEAFWVSLNTRQDLLDPGEFLVVEADDAYYSAIFWPGHPFTLGGGRRGVPREPGWSGYSLDKSRCTRLDRPAVAVVEWAPVAGARCRVTASNDSQQAVGKVGVIERVNGGDRNTPYLVVFDEGQDLGFTWSDGGAHKYWVTEVEAETTEETTTSWLDEYPVGHFFTLEGEHTGEVFVVSGHRDNVVEYTARPEDTCHTGLFNEAIMRSSSPYVEPTAEPTPAVFEVDQAVHVDYPFWTGDGVIVRLPSATEVRVRMVTGNQTGREGTFAHGHLTPIVVPTIDYPIVNNRHLVPTSAHVVRLIDRDVTSHPAGTYMAVHHDGRWALLSEPGMTGHDHAGARDWLPTPLRGYRLRASREVEDLGPVPAPATVPTAEPVADGYPFPEIPVPHRATAPAGLVRVRVTDDYDGTLLAVGGEYLAVPHASRTGRHVVALWPGHPLHGRSYDRSAAGVPLPWRGIVIYSRYVNEVVPVEPVPVDVTEVEALRARLAQVEREYAEDMQTIARMMNEQAERREWCEEYEEVMARINRETHADFSMAQRPIRLRVDYNAAGGLIGGVVEVEVPNGHTDDQIRAAVRDYLVSVGSYGGDTARVDMTTLAPGSITLNNYDVIE